MAKQKPAAVGDVFAFSFADGQFGACRVLRTEGGPDGCVLAAATSWVGTDWPTIDTPGLVEVPRETRQPDYVGPRLWWVDRLPPAEFRRIGSIPPTPLEANAEHVGAATWTQFPRHALTWWRYEYDREALLAELREARDEREEAYQPATRTALAELRLRTHLEGWKGYAEPAALRACRKAVRDAIDALLALGPRPPEPMAFDVLRHCTERFNDIQDEYDLDIDTICREDICEVLGEIADAVGLEDYGESVAAYRGLVTPDGVAGAAPTARQ